MRTLRRILEHVDEALGARRELRVDPAHVRHVEETALREDPTLDLDEFGRRYVHELRQRIVDGVKARRPLTETRPQMLYFRDAARGRKRA